MKLKFLLGAGLALSVSVPLASAQPNRTFDGTGNNIANPGWGAAGAVMLRGPSGAHYADGIGEMKQFANPRACSNALGVQIDTGNALDLSSMFWQWGQFIDHDFAFAPESHDDPAPIAVPQGDPFFDPMGTGTQVIPMMRSEFQGGVTTPREQSCAITHYLDGSMVYGSDEVRAAALREGVGGRLLTSPGDLLPKNTAGLPNAGGPSPNLFLAGDIRANEQTALTAMHTIFVREHNYWAARVAAQNPGWTDEQIYQKTRKIVGAEIQSITYNEWLPLLVGQGRIPQYNGYDSGVNASISNEFAGAAFRFGHSMLNEQLLRYGVRGAAYGNGHLSLFQAFFNVSHIEEPGGVDAVIRGLAWQEANGIDTQVVGAVRNMLFGPPGSGGLDLLALNLNRAMDHGLPDYNTLREDLGLPRRTSFSQVTSDPTMQTKLADTYGSVDTIDPWIGMMVEDHLPGAASGETLAAALLEQFERMRDGDRYFYLNDAGLDPSLISEIESTTLSDIILRTTDIESLQSNVFVFEAVCYADCDDSTGAGVLDIFDFLCFQDAYIRSDPYADCDGSGTFNIFDFLCFVDAYLAGCP